MKRPIDWTKDVVEWTTSTGAKYRARFGRGAFNAGHITLAHKTQSDLHFSVYASLDDFDLDIIDALRGVADEDALGRIEAMRGGR